jgi:hypothetical protein
MDCIGTLDGFWNRATWIEQSIAVALFVFGGCFPAHKKGRRGGDRGKALCVVYLA